MNQQTFDALSQSYENALVAKGIGYSSRYEALAHANQIIRRHEVEGLTQLEENIVTEYLHGITERFYSGTMGKLLYCAATRHIIAMLFALSLTIFLNFLAVKPRINSGIIAVMTEIITWSDFERK